MAGAQAIPHEPQCDSDSRRLKHTLMVVPMFVVVQDVSPVPQAVPAAQASCVLPPQGAQRTGPMVTGLGVNPLLQVDPAQTGSLLPPQMSSQDIMSALSR